MARFNRQSAAQGRVSLPAGTPEMPSTDLCRLIAESSVDWDHWVDSQGRLLYVSPSCERITGYSAEDFLSDGRLFEKIVHPEDSETALKTVFHNPKGREAAPRSSEFRIIHRRGDVRWISHVSQAVYTTDGDFLGRRGSGRDITEQKAQEQALKEREATYRAVVEDQTELLCRFQPDGTVTFVNCACCRNTGKARDDLIGANFFGLLPEDLRQEVREKLAVLTSEAAVCGFEHKVASHRDLQWRQWCFRGVFDKSGALLHLQAVGRDVTDRKRTEKALHTSEARYFNLLNAIPDGVVAYDPHGRVTYVNDGFKQLYGWTHEELIGGPIDFVPPEEREGTRRAWERTVRGEKVFFETKRLTKDGRMLDIQLRTAIIVDRSGNFSESIIIHRDITERKRAQVALQQAYDNLERRVQERTAELAKANDHLRREISVRKDAELRLRESESRYRDLVENAPLGIVSCDKHGRLKHVNATVLEIAGCSMTAETKMINLLRFPPLQSVGIADEVRRCLESGASNVFERPYTSPTGKQTWIRVHMVPTRDAIGEINGSQATVEDITFRKQAEAALSESEERFRAVFETAQDGIFLKDRNLVYTHVNPAYLSAFNLPVLDIIGKTDEDFLGSHEAAYIKDLEHRVFSGQIIEATYVVTVQGGSRTLHCVRVPMRDAAGDTIGICGIARDITQRKALEKRCGRTGVRYRSPAMLATLDQLRLSAETDSIVLLLGESGAGKDHLAKYLHDNSKRAGGPFFAINCAALATSIAESELFGHEAGSFTGSRARKLGLLELAEGGTLLLNEIGELSPELQAKLLTFLDTQQFTRVGGGKTIQVNARIVAATNRDLEKEVQAGRFRSDLYYRLSVFVIRTPTLRERREDIPLLAEEILETLALKLGRTVPPVLDVTAVDALSRYSWPGNVRELRNVLERALILCRANIVRSENLGLPRKPGTVSENVKDIQVDTTVSGNCNMIDALESTKRRLVQEALKRCTGNVTAAARVLGVSRDAVRHYIKTLGIDKRGEGREHPRA